MNRPFDALTSTGVATGLVAPLALAAPGNLDPGFSDHGRVVLTEFFGQAWSVDALDDGGAFVAGGDYYAGCYLYCIYDGTDFAHELTGDGGIGNSYTPAELNGIEVRDAVRQPDGKAVMVGRRIGESREINTLTVYRVDGSGTLDASFGSAGVFRLPAGAYGERHTATSVALDPDGRIVVAGSSNERLIVLRLLADGSLDASFGDGGVHVGPFQDYDSRTFVERTGAGAYRVTTTGSSQCRVVGLTATGTLDSSFGTAGIAPVAEGEAASCLSMASQDDGSVLISGAANGQGFATRLLETGAPDPAFSAVSVAASMTEATAIDVAGDGKVLVGGIGEPGAMVMRLAANGDGDASFGDAGRTFIDLPSDFGSLTRINALDTGTDGRILAAGGDLYTRRPFVIQLQGDGGADSSGVVSFVAMNIEATEGGDLSVKLRRSGGKSGAVSVDYQTGTDPYDPDSSATAGADYGEVAGTLSWADGDTGEREIIVPILADAGKPEEYEWLQVALSNVQGGAGLGQRTQPITILPDGSPGGQFELSAYGPSGESGSAEVAVFRNYYFEGEVSVTVTPVAGTATAGDDFDATPITLTWADGESTAKVARIRIVNDDLTEGAESFTVELSSPTGGAILGPRVVGKVVIPANNSKKSGGGGSTGWLPLLLLGLAELFRRVSPASRAS